jgi:hypothetical protein
MHDPEEGNAVTAAKKGEGPKEFAWGCAKTDFHNIGEGRASKTSEKVGKLRHH